jgi:hypothetical protein
MRAPNYRVAFRKRGEGPVLQGTYHDDGLSSLSSVQLDSGETAYLSVLDQIVSREQIGPDGDYVLAGLSDARWSK